MNSLFNSWQFNLLGYLVFIVFFTQYYKLAVRDAKRDGAATILLQTLAGLLVLVFVPFFPMTFPTDPKVWIMLIIASVFYALNDRLQTTTRKNLQVSMFVILDRLSTIFLIIIGFTVFQNPFAWNKVLGALLILSGNIVALYKRGKIELNKYVLLSILATLSFSVAVSIDIDISKHFNLPIYTMLTLVAPALMISIAEKIKPTEVIAQFTPETRKYYLITAISWGLIIMFILRAYQFGEVTVVAPLAALSVLVNVLIAYVFMGEKTDKVKKIVAAIITVIGIYLTVPH